MCPSLYFGTGRASPKKYPFPLSINLASSSVEILSLEGTLTTKGRVIIGVDGFIKGNVETANADVEGKISGQLLVSETLTIKSTAIISGDVVIGKLSVEPGATFNATCAMKGAVKELNQPNEQKNRAEKTA